MLTNLVEVQDAIRGLSVSKALGPDGIPNRALKCVSRRVILLLFAIFNVILQMQHFPSVWKHACVISILKRVRDPTLPSSYWPISFLDTIGRGFEKILLASAFSEINGRGLLHDEEFGFSPKHNVSLQLARLVERISRNFGEKRLTGAVFLDMAKTFYTVRVDGLVYKPLTSLNTW